MRASVVALVGVIAAACPGSASAQFGAGAGGVIVTPDGAIEVERAAPLSRRAKPSPTASEARTLSLRRLLGDLAARGDEPLPPDAAHLGGLTRIDEVIVTPDDVLLVGPAAALRYDEGGVAVFDRSTIPAVPLLLEDLAVAIEHAAAGRGVAGCSIDQTAEGLRRLQAYLQANSSPASAAVAAARYPNMARALGTQSIRIFGLPPESHAAYVTVAADVMLKQIALGLRPSGTRKVKSQLALLRPQGNSVQRWWFAPKYEPIAVWTSEDNAATGYRLAGGRLKVLAQDEIVSADGQKADAAQTRDSTEAFARMFTQNVDEVAERMPEIRALQGLTDLFMVAALLGHHESSRPESARPLEWDITAAIAAADIPRTPLPVPQTIESSAVSKRAGRVVLGLIGGVEIRPATMTAEAGFADVAPAPSMISPIPDGQWFADPPGE